MAAGNNEKIFGYQLDQKKVGDVIGEYEEQTSAEIVPMVVKASDSYPATIFKISFLLFFAFIMTNVSYEFILEMTAWHITGFALLSYLLAQAFDNVAVIKRAFLSREEIDEEVRQRAIEEFFKRELHHTNHRSGVLIFISLLEHRIEILCDKGVKEKIDQEHWDKCIATMIPHLKTKNLAEAMTSGIDSVGNLLIKHFPKDENDSSDSNQLDNSVIVEE